MDHALLPASEGGDMEVRNGFIVGVFNYCDHWCERCAFQGRCAVFADRIEWEFEHDHGPLTVPMHERQAQQMAERVTRWEEELGIDFSKIEKSAETDVDVELPEVKLEHLELHERVMDFSDRILQWLEGFAPDNRGISEPLEVIHQFAYFAAAKVRRALLGLADDERYGSCGDTEGSAKAALIALERLRTAWRELVDGHFVKTESVAALIDEATWIIQETERHVPNARLFIRPGFDELDDVRKLEASER
jgi:hypothetical protein